MPLDTGVSAYQLAPETDEMAAASQARDTRMAQAGATAGRPAAPALGGPAPAAAAPAATKYDPEQALRAHLQKQFPDMTPDHWNFAKNFYKSKVYQHNMKQLGAEHSTMLGDYLHHLLLTDAEKRRVRANAEESRMLERAYNEEVKAAGGTPPAGLIAPKDRPDLQARFTKDVASHNAADATRHEKFLRLDKYLKEKTGHGLDEELLDPMMIKLMVHNAKGGTGTADEDIQDLMDLTRDTAAAY